MATPAFCPNCQRANPPGANHCHFDGVGLRAGIVSAELGRDFSFPDGRRCRTFDELVSVCSEKWEAGMRLLRAGAFKHFFSSIGRMDLAIAADKAAARDDLDLGLDQLLSLFPCKDKAQPKLDLAPRRIQLGAVPAGQSRELTITVINRGKRLLHGNLEIRGGDWLRLAGFTSSHGKIAIKASPTLQLPLQISTQGLPAGQRYSATVTFITNGGAAEVPVTLDVVPIPFPSSPLQGACTPKELATAMKEHPKPASTLLENGQVERWFLSNGWRYPIIGPPAKGVAAVQQFFEALGLSKAPILRLKPDRLSIEVDTEPVAGSFELETNEKKWVYAYITSDQAWLEPTAHSVSGPVRCTVGYEINPRLLRQPGQHAGQLTLIGNGQQRLTFDVLAQMRENRSTWSRRWLWTPASGLLVGLLLRISCWPLDVLGNEPQGLAVAQIFIIGWGLCGALAGIWLMRNRSNEPSEVLASLLAGGWFGMLGGATVACLWRVVDPVAATWLPLFQPAAGLLFWSLAGLSITVGWRPLSLLLTWTINPLARMVRFLVNLLSLLNPARRLGFLANRQLI